jgi:hypothetical protein
VADEFRVAGTAGQHDRRDEARGAALRILTHGAALLSRR